MRKDRCVSTRGNSENLRMGRIKLHIGEKIKTVMLFPICNTGI